MIKIGILGASGAVGRQMLQCLEERNIDCEVRVFASERSVGQQIPFKDTTLTIKEVNETNLKGLDYVLGAVSNSLSKQYLPLIQASKAVYIDNSSAFRGVDEIPLVVPEINGEDALKHQGIIANPNCSTIITLMALAPIAKISPITSIVACTYQAVSGAGMQGINELEEEIEQIRNDEEITPKVFPTQIAYNCIAEIGTYNENGYTTEEMKMQNEGRKILHLPDLKVTCTCVRVPVYRSHSISATFQTEDIVTIEQAEEAIKNFSGVKLVNEHVPTPLETSDQDIVYVGRVRKDLTNDHGLTLWCCGDQIRKGAASNAVSILEYLENNK